MYQGNAPFQALDVLATDFVIQDVRHLVRGDLLACGPFMNAIQFVRIVSA